MTRAFLLLFAFLACSLPAEAGVRGPASWPLARHDPARTALVPGSTNIQTPGIAWSYYLGGALSNDQDWAGDIDGSGQEAIIFVGGGRLLAKRADDTVLWRSPQLGLGSIVDVWDVDGDGVLDVVATGAPGTVGIFSTRDGSLEWSMPSSAGIGTVGQVRTVDLDGDGKRDIYVADCGCCTAMGANGAVAFSFAGGFAGAAQLWSIPPSGCDTGDLITDINGDGVPDVLRVGGNAIVAYDGKTGAAEFSSTAGADGSLAAYFGSMLSAPSAAGSSVAVYFQSVYYASIDVGGQRVLGFGYDPASKALVKNWEVDAAAQAANGEIRFDASSIGRFDATGSWEVAASFHDASTGVWTLDVIDATTGTVIASQTGATYEGAADVDGDGIPEILASASGTLTVLKLVRANGGATGVLQAGATSPGLPTTHLDRSLSAWEAADEPVASTPLSRTQKADVLVMTSSNPVVYEAVDLSAGSGAGMVVASFQAPMDTSLLSTNLFTDPATQLPQPYLALSSGYLAVLDPTTLQATNLGTSSQFPMPGMRTGGYYSGPSDVEPTPVVGSFSGSGSPSVVCEASNGALVRLDPGTSASVAQPPTPVWSLPGFTYPSLVDLNGDGSPEVLAREVDAGVVSAYGSDGKTLLWTASTPGGTYDLPFGDVNGDGVPDIFYEFDDQNAGMVLQMNVLDGRTGAALWNPTFSLPIAAGVSPLAVADMNGDGAADAVSATNHLLYLSGPTGSPLASNPDVLGYAEPLVANVLGGANPQAFLHGGAYAPRLDAADGGTIWVVDAGLAATAWTGRYGAIAPCDGGSVFIEGEYYSPVLHAFSAQTGAEAWRTTLSGGQGLSDPGSIPPGTYVGALGNVAVKEDLTGTGHMDALVGSTDGYLYAVQACNGGALDWAYDFGYPVGEPIVADTMGTGKDQVLVSVADGYLYALQQASIQPPGYVYAVDPPGGHPHDPVSTIDTVDTLYAEWSQVPGATGYQWAVYTSAGTLVGMTGYQTTGYTAGQLPDGGAVVDVTASSLPLVNEGRYYFAVRAVNAAGPSSDALSNTVEVLMPDGGVMTDAGPNDAGVKGGQDAGTTGDAGVPSCSLPDAGASQSPPHSCHGCGPGGPADVVEDLLGFLAALGFTRRQSRRGKHLTGQTARR